MKKYIGALIIILGLGCFVVSFFFEQLILFFIGIPVLLFGVFMLVFVMVYELYQKDKTIDYEIVKKYGFTVVDCPNCGKENVLEDQYCIHCGERLDQNEV